MTGLLGGAFDPPHNGHVAIAATAVERFDLDELVVLVSERPGHKRIALAAATRLELARAAFPGCTVELDPHERTIDTLRAGRWSDPLFLIGADEFADFLDWKDPDAVLSLARLGVSTRPGFARDRLDPVLSRLSRPDRVEFFEIEPLPISSTELRERLGRGEDVDDAVPQAVAEIIRERGLYRREPGLH